VRVVAARCSLSLSALVAQQLAQPTEADERYELARAVALAALTATTDRGTFTWRREELYAR